MAVGNQCCCLHIKSCATIVGILGLITSIIAVFGCFVVWIAAPIVIVMLLTYIFILVGVNKQSPGYMLAAEIILGFKIGFCVFTCILVLILGLVSSNFAGWIYRQAYANRYRNGYSYDAANIEKTVETIFLCIIFVILALSSWNIYSCIIVHRARTWFEENAAPMQHRFYPYGYGGGPMQVHVHNSSNASQLNTAAGTPQGLITEAPHFPHPQSNNASPAVYPKVAYPTAPPPPHLQHQHGYANSGFQ